MTQYFSPRSLLLYLFAGSSSVIALLLMMLPSPIAHAAGQDGAVDLTFASGAGPNNTVGTIVVQNDGKILVAGGFTIYHNTPVNRIIRLNSDGSLDPTFNVGAGPNSSVSSIVVQSDGKILVAGSFTGFNNVSRKYIARLNSDGSLDPTFNVGTGAGANSSIIGTAIQSDGKIVIIGVFSSYDGMARNYIARLNSDGSLDTTFDVGEGVDSLVLSVAIQTDDKVLIAGSFSSYNGTLHSYVARLNTNGSLDTTFGVGTGPNNTVNSIVLQSDGRVIIGGFFTTYNDTASNHVARLNMDGSLDPTFNVGTGANNGVYSVAQSNGKVIIGGDFTSYNDVTSTRVAQLNSDGSLDTTFNVGTGVNNTVYSVARQSNGKVIIGGIFTGYKGIGVNRIARLNNDGSLDTTLNVGAGANATISSLAIQSDSKVLIGGNFTIYDGKATNLLARLNSDGSLDPTFNVGSGANNTVTSIAVQNDGKIIIGGNFTSYNGTAINRIARLNSNGSLDPTFNVTFGANNTVTNIVFQSDGKIIIGGNFTSYNDTPINRIARLNPDGSLDTTFNVGTGANNNIYSVAIQNDGKILIGGMFTSYNDTPINRIARLNSAGSLDPTFNVGTGADNVVVSLASQSDGKVLIGGTFVNYNGAAINRIARLNSDGSLDTTFNVGSGANNVVANIAIQRNGKILIVGSFTTYNGTDRRCIARLNSDGSLDPAFNTGSGPNSSVSRVRIQVDDKVIIGGNFSSVDSYTRDFVARLEATNRTSTSVTVVSNINPSAFEQSVTFSAAITPISSTGTVSFNFNGLTTPPSPVVNGIATYVTDTLAIGTHTVTVTYSGDANYLSSSSVTYTQQVVPCNPQIVTHLTDDGKASVCGAFSYALATTASGTITFALSSGNTITFTGSLTPTLKAGVAIDGGINGIVLEGNRVAGDGLRLGGSNQLTNLTIKSFAGRELIASLGNATSWLFKVKLQN